MSRKNRKLRRQAPKKSRISSTGPKKSRICSTGLGRTISFVNACRKTRFSSIGSEKIMNSVDRLQENHEIYPSPSVKSPISSSSGKNHEFRWSSAKKSQKLSMDYWKIRRSAAEKSRVSFIASRKNVEIGQVRKNREFPQSGSEKSWVSSIEPGEIASFFDRAENNREILQLGMEKSRDSSIDCEKIRSSVDRVQKNHEIYRSATGKSRYLRLVAEKS